MGKVLVLLSGVNLAVVARTASRIYEILNIDGTDFEIQIQSAENGAILDADEERKIVAEWKASHPVRN